MIGVQWIRHPVGALGRQCGGDQFAALRSRQSGEATPVLLPRVTVQCRELSAPTPGWRLTRLSEVRTAIRMNEFDALPISRYPLRERAAHAAEPRIAQFARQRLRPVA
jgi:hypothetical protein